uniref:ELM2 domain-containing protein n=1 Tax=Panagrellus redivivus TaxID=6233 RepID=A0A7E4VHV9_PANRE
MSSSKRISKVPSAKRLIKKPLRPTETTIAKAGDTISARIKEDIFRADSPLLMANATENPYAFLDNEDYKEDLTSVEVEMEPYGDVKSSDAGPFRSSNLDSVNSSNFSSFNGSTHNSLNGSFLSSIHGGSNQNSFDESTRRLPPASGLNSVDNGQDLDENGDDDDAISEPSFSNNSGLLMSSPIALHEDLDEALNELEVNNYRTSNGCLGFEDDFKDKMHIDDPTVMDHSENNENVDITGNPSAPEKRYGDVDDEMM